MTWPCWTIASSAASPWPPPSSESTPWYVLTEQIHDRGHNLETLSLLYCMQECKACARRASLTIDQLISLY